MTKHEIIISQLRQDSIENADLVLAIPEEDLMIIASILKRTQPKLITVVRNKSALTKTLVARHGRLKAHIIARCVYGYPIMPETEL